MDKNENEGTPKATAGGHRHEKAKKRKAEDITGEGEEVFEGEKSISLRSRELPRLLPASKSCVATLEAVSRSSILSSAKRESVWSTTCGSQHVSVRVALTQAMPQRLCDLSASICCQHVRLSAEAFCWRGKRHCSEVEMTWKHFFLLIFVIIGGCFLILLSIQVCLFPPNRRVPLCALPLNLQTQRSSWPRGLRLADLKLS